jgi:hypothetical protein
LAENHGASQARTPTKNDAAFPRSDATSVRRKLTPKVAFILVRTLANLSRMGPCPRPFLEFLPIVGFGYFALNKLSHSDLLRTVF